MANKNSLEYQARFRADTSELKTAQKELEKTSRSMRGLATVGGGIVTMSSGFRDAMRGNAQGLVTMAAGAGMVWKALSQLSPVLKVISVALAVASAAQMLFSHRQREAADEAENLKQKLRDLGVAQTALDTSRDRSDDRANAMEKYARTADAAAASLVKLAAAQLDYNKALDGLSLSELDLKEAQALSDPKLTDKDRIGIQRDFTDRRAEQMKKQAQSQWLDQDSLLGAERSAIRQAARNEQAKGRQLTENARDAESLLVDKIAQLLQEGRGKSGAALASGFRQSAARDLQAATSAYSPFLTGEQAGEINAYHTNLTDRQKELKAFQDQVAANKTERDTRYTENFAMADSLKTARDQRLIDIETERVRSKTQLDQNEANIQIAQANREAAANTQASQAERQYRYDEKSDPDKLAIVDKALKRTQEIIAGTTGEAQAQARMQLVDQLRERKDVQGRIGQEQGRIELEQTRAEAEDQKKRMRSSLLQGDVEQIRASRSERDMSTRDVFQHMYSVQAGKNPDQVVADNTAAMKERLTEIADLLGDLKK